MKYADLIGSIIYLVSGLFVWYNVYRALKAQNRLIDAQRKHIHELQQMIDLQNQRQVGLLAIFQMLLKNLQDKTGTKI